MQARKQVPNCWDFTAAYLLIPKEGPAFATSAPVTMPCVILEQSHNHSQLMVTLHLHVGVGSAALGQQLAPVVTDRMQTMIVSCRIPQIHSCRCESGEFILSFEHIVPMMRRGRESTERLLFSGFDLCADETGMHCAPSPPVIHS